jgi:hypothetical protein
MCGSGFYQCADNFPLACDVGCPPAPPGFALPSPLAAPTTSEVATVLGNLTLYITLGIIGALIIIAIVGTIIGCKVYRRDQARMDARARNDDKVKASEARANQAEMTVVETKAKVVEMEEQLKYTAFSGAYAGEFLREWLISIRDLTFEKEIGRGSQGAVWLGKMKQAKVAIKLATSRNVDPEIVESMKNEAKLILCVDIPPNICGAAPNRHFLAVVWVATRILCRRTAFAWTKVDSTSFLSIARADPSLRSLVNLLCHLTANFALLAMLHLVWLTCTLQECSTVMSAAETSSLRVIMLN